MNEHVIPPEAVEAAWATMWDVPGVPRCNATREEVRLALEAAAPHIRAQTLEEAADAWDMRSGEFEDTTPGYLKYLAVKERATHGNH